MADRVAPDQQLARLARAQGGIVSGAQLRAAGLTRQSVHQRVVAGRLHRVHLDVFAVGHLLPGALNDDRERDVELVLAGYRVLRFTWEQVTFRPGYVIAAIAAALGASRSSAA